MVDKEEVESIIEDLIQQLYKAKGFDNLDCNPFERDLFETEMKKLWEDVEAHIILYTEYKEGIEILNSENTVLANENYNLRLQNDNLLNRLDKISKVVNDTWC